MDMTEEYSRTLISAGARATRPLSTGTSAIRPLAVAAGVCRRGGVRWIREFTP